jgi:hypothetical protein
LGSCGGCRPWRGDRWRRRRRGSAGGQFRDASQRLSDRTARSVTFTPMHKAISDARISSQRRARVTIVTGEAPAPRTPPPPNPAAVKATIVAVIAATVDVDRVDLFGHRRVRSHHRHWRKRPDSAASVGAAAIAAAAALVTSIGVMKFSFVRMGLLPYWPDIGSRPAQLFWLRQSCALAKPCRYCSLPSSR